MNRQRSGCSCSGWTWTSTGLTKLRLGEHAVHSWDVAVALDPAATVAADAVTLLIDGLGPLIARAGRPAASPQTVHVTTTAPDRELVLETGEPVRLEAAPGRQAMGRS